MWRDATPGVRRDGGTAPGLSRSDGDGGEPAGGAPGGVTAPWPVLPLPTGLETPTLVVDEVALERNLARMAAHAAARGIALRPHAKTHKSCFVAQRQLHHGANGLTVATLGEAEVFAAAGVEDLFVAYPLWMTAERGQRLDRLARVAKLRVGVDSVEGVAALAGALHNPASVEVSIEVDCGQHRSGVAPELAGRVARAAADRGLVVAGLFTHGGHSYAGPSSVARAAEDEARALARGAESLAAVGVGAAVLSAGSTPTAALAHGPVNEVRPGTYALNDRQQVALGSCAPGDVAGVVAATVVSTAVAGQAVLDAGSKALAGESKPLLEGFGVVPALGGAVVRSLSEHHAVVELSDAPPALGSVVGVVPNHICTAVNLFDEAVLVREGRLVGRFPIDARGRLG